MEPSNTQPQPGQYQPQPGQLPSRQTNATPAQRVPLRAQLIIKETVYFQTPTDPAYYVEDAYGLLVEYGDEQPYARKLKVGPEWRPLDLGWLGDKAGVVHLRNEGPLPLEVGLKRAAGDVIRLSLIRPGATRRDEPLLEEGTLVLRVRADKAPEADPNSEARVSLNVFPR